VSTTPSENQEAPEDQATPEDIESEEQFAEGQLVLDPYDDLDFNGVQDPEAVDGDD
jgi:hypothetical protein